MDEKYEIRNIEIKKREGSVVHIKHLLKNSHIKIDDWILLKAKNLVNKQELFFPANVRSNYRINIRKSIRSNLGLKFDKKSPVKFNIIKRLEKINLKNEDISDVSTNLLDSLPNQVITKDKIVKLNCFKWQKNKFIFSYKNSKSSNHIILNKNFNYDPIIVGLWRAEGGKYSLVRSSLQFTNTNLEVIEKWISFIKSLGFSNTDLRLSYYIQYISPKKDHEREERLMNFWSRKLNIPKDHFGFIFKKGPGHKAKSHGCLQIKFNNSTLSFIIQYLFLKFEDSIRFKKWSEDVAINYIKGTLCDCNCSTKCGVLCGINFSTSCMKEAELYRDVLLKYFSITSKIYSDKRSECFYVNVGGWENFIHFLRFKLFDSIPWKGDNLNYTKFKSGIVDHLYSKILVCFSKGVIDVNKIYHDLFSFKDSLCQSSTLVLIKRAINFLLLNGFLIEKNKNIILSKKGIQVLNDLGGLSSLLPAA